MSPVIILNTLVIEICSCAFCLAKFGILPTYVNRMVLEEWQGLMGRKEIEESVGGCNPESKLCLGSSCAARSSSLL